MTAKSPLAKIVVHMVLCAGSLLFLFPLIWMISTSVKPVSQTQELPPRLTPYPELIKAEDGNRYPAVYYRAKPDQKESDDKLVALLAVEAGEQAAGGGDTALAGTGPVPVAGREVAAALSGARQALVEVDGVGAQKVQEWVPTSTLRVPPVWRWDNYRKAVTYKAEQLGFIPFLQYGKNTLYIAILSVLGTILSNSLVAYGFARINWPGRNVAFALTIATMMIPFPVLMVPVYVVFKSLGWVGSPKPLWVPAFFGSAFNIFLLRQFFMSIPFELSDAAKIDGCSEFRIFRDIIMPLSRPALAVVALFNFMHVWNDFLGPLIYLTDQKMYTLAYGLQAYQSQHGGTPWPLLMAASTIVVLPVIVIFFFAQKTFIQGITVTGMKN